MDYLKGFVVSLLLHGFAVLGLFMGGMHISNDKPQTQTVDISAFLIERPEPVSVAEFPPSPVPVPAIPAPEQAPAPKPKPAAPKPVPKPKQIDKPKAVSAPPVVPDEPVTEAEPKYVSDYGEKEYVPVAAPENADLPAYDGAGYVGGEKAETDSGSGTGAGEGTVGGSGNADAVANYMSINLAGIRKKIYDRLEYPSQARRMGMRGTTEVKFRIHPNGRVDDVSVNKSSGQRILDDAAVKAVKNASPLPKPSEAVYIVLSVSFSLR